MSSGLVGSSIHQGLDFSELPRAGDGFVHIPFLVGVHHQLSSWTNLLSHDARPPQVFGRNSAYLELEMGPAFDQRFVTQSGIFSSLKPNHPTDVVYAGYP